MSLNKDRLYKGVRPTGRWMNSKERLRATEEYLMISKYHKRRIQEAHDAILDSSRALARLPYLNGDAISWHVEKVIEPALEAERFSTIKEYHPNGGQ